MENKITLQVFNADIELEQQRNLFADCFPETIGTSVIETSHYNWKFHTTNTFEYSAYIGDEIVGYYAAIPYQYKIGAQKHSVGMVCDVMTSSKYRGKGIFTTLGRYSLGKMASENLSFTMGYPRRKEVIPGHLKVGWDIIFDLPLYASFLSSKSLLQSKKLGFLYPFVNIALGLYQLLKTPKAQKTYSVERYGAVKDVEGYNAFVEKWMQSASNTLDKRLDFANWRYGAPGASYQFLACRNSMGELVGFMSVRKVVKEGVLSFAILDLMVLPSDTKCLNNLFYTLKHNAKIEKVEALLCMMSKHSASKYKLPQMGFVKTPVVFKLIINILGGKISGDKIKDEESWHLMWVDSDDL